MSETILCKICGKRRARRHCPAVHGDICAICCGTEREVSLSCPLECEYLQEAHRREKPVPIDDTQIPDPDIAVTEEFLRDHEELLLFCMVSLVEAALRISSATDADALEALDALIKTYRTTESGLLYETRPVNTIAAAVQRAFSASLEDYQKIRAERENLSYRNAEILGVLVFLRRLSQGNQNGRPRGRMYLDLLRQMTPATARDERVPGIIV
ncbi:MAG TPA: hypothetical protein VGK64_11580 [Bryobacteraceae bacterium]